MRLCLYQPDIAGNVGTILRMAACLGVGVDIVEPCGFAYGDRALRRAGLDYADHGAIRRHADWPAFRAAAAGRIVLLTTAGGTRLDAAGFARDDILLRGGGGIRCPAARP